MAKPTTRLPPFRKGRKKGPPGLTLYWPLNDGPNATSTIRLCRFGFFAPYALGSTTEYGELNHDATSANWNYDPRVGGFCLNLARGTSGKLTNTSSALSAISVGTSFTASIWFYLKSLPVTSNSYLFAHTNGFPGNQNFGLYIDQATGKGGFFFTDGSGANYNIVNTTAALPLNRWHQILGTYNGAKQKLYLDGKLQATNSTSTTPDTGGTWGVGAFVSFVEAPNALLWQALVYNRALSPSEIYALYTDPFDLSDDPPILPPVEPPTNPPPPPASASGIGGLIVGDIAIPIKSGNYVIGPRSGHTPIY